MQLDHPKTPPELPQTAEVSDGRIARCRTEQDAFRLCIQCANPFRENRDLAEILGLSESHFSRIINADRHRQPRHAGRVFQIRLQQVCNNRVVDRWAELYDAGVLTCQQEEDDPLARLQAELEEDFARLKRKREQLNNAL